MPTSPVRATTDDLAALLDLIQSAYRGEPSRAGWTTEADLLDGSRTDEALLRADLTDPATVFLVVRDGDGLLACCAVTDRRDGRAYFGTFAVRPTAQGAGTGGSLLAAAEAHAWNIGCRWMEMTVLAPRADLLAWYNRWGYVLTGESRPFPYHDGRFGRPRHNDLRFVVLEKPLSPPPAPDRMVPEAAV